MAVSTEEEVFEPYPLDELQWYETASGAKCFVGNVDDVCEHAEANGEQIYYVLGKQKYEYKEGHTTYTGYHTRTFKVVNTFAGRAILEADDDEIGLEELKPNAWFALPKIPYNMVKKLDQFFRAVHQKHGTESIVLLTFDSTKTDSSGWGVLIPKQENTSHDCDYDPTSIAEDKPAHVYIVGSAHSHPEMSAYASTTDHKDQATFDGLHITFGWIKGKNGGATEFHIEFQISGRIFEFTPGQVYDDVPVEAPDEEVETWMAAVSKKTFTTTHQHGGYPILATPNSTYSGTGSSVSKTKIKLPAGAPTLEEATIIGELDDTTLAQTCPFCSEKLLQSEIDKGRCLTCHSYLLVEGKTLEDLIQTRQEHKFFCYEIDPSTGPHKDIVVWRSNGNFDVLFTATGVSSSLGKSSGD